MKPEIIEITEKNLSKYPASCFKNPKDEGYKEKGKWILNQLKSGLKIKTLYFDGDKKCHGFIEYIDGENAWRGVESANYTFIHCIWIYPNEFKDMGYGTLLLNEAVQYAKNNNKAGVALVASDKPFMADNSLFLKNGFKVIQKEGGDSLLAISFKKGMLPKFNDFEKRLSEYKGINIIYSNQCPWVAKFIKEIKPYLSENGIKVKFKELKTAQDAQNAPSIYSTFNLIKDGKIYADRYISKTRFINILTKEMKYFSTKA